VAKKGKASLSARQVSAPRPVKYYWTNLCLPSPS